MRRTIKTYESIMIAKVLACKTPFEVLGIIDKKIKLITKRTDDTRFIAQFISNSLVTLKRINETASDPIQYSKIRSAIAHLQNLQIRFNIK